MDNHDAIRKLYDAVKDLASATAKINDVADALGIELAKPVDPMM